jgi:hypothetical protein
MRPIKFLLVLAAISLCAAASVENEIKIVANPALGTSEISRDELNRISL